MSRYVSKATAPRADWDDPCPLLPALSVDGQKQVDTGLVDRLGNAIMRVQNPIGFGRR
jgi:hypothetical protein